MLFTAILLHLLFFWTKQLFSKEPFIFLQQKPNFWTFRENLLIRMLSTAKLLPLAVSKRLKIFLQKNQSCFRKSNFWTFWEILIIESHSTINLLPVAVFENLRSFYRRIYLFFPNKSRFSKVLRNLTDSVAFYANFSTFSDF